MKVFVTGASGFIGSAIVQELLKRGHQVTGLARSEASANAIEAAGAKVLKGGLEDLDILKQGASEADGVIHTAFIHDFTQYHKANDAEKAALQAMGDALKGTDKPIVIAAGILGLPKTNGITTEDDAAVNSPRSSEGAAAALAAQGINASVIRLAPSVHDKGDKGFIPFIIAAAKKNGASAYVGDGSNRWPGVHRLDAAELFCLALEKGAKGALYNGIADNGIPLKEIAELIGKKTGLPVKALSDEEATRHFEWMKLFVSFDGIASNEKTQQELNWHPKHIGLLEDMELNYF